MAIAATIIGNAPTPSLSRLKTAPTLYLHGPASSCVCLHNEGDFLFDPTGRLAGQRLR